MTKLNLKGAIIIASLFVSIFSSAQCPLEPVGVNLVQNPGFEDGDVNFNSPLFSWNANGDVGPGGRTWSEPGEYWVGNSSTFFNGAFAGSPHSGNNMLMVDADCNAGGIIWEQTVNVMPSTNYYFSLWVASLHTQDPAQLIFEVNGVTLGTSVNAPATTGNWLFYEDVWNSGGLNGNVQLRIRESSGVGCSNGDDFAIDDINFIPGCQFGATGPTPDLGPDLTLCGAGGSLTLNPNVTGGGLTYEWNTGQTSSTINVSSPGTYSVCVRQSGSCPKSDIIVVTNDFSVDLGPNIDLCDVGGVQLDAGAFGPNATYEWRKNGVVLPNDTLQTLFVNTVGTFRVDVTVPGCGTRNDQVTVTSSAPTANNQEYCPPDNITLSVTGSGTFEWYTTPTGGSSFHSGSSYNVSPPGGNVTYYVEDVSSFSTTVGPPAVGHGLSGGPQNRGVQNETRVVFDVLVGFTIDTVTVIAPVWNCNESFGVEVFNSGGGSLGSGSVTLSAGCGGSGGSFIPVKIPVGVAVPIGTNFQLRLSQGQIGWFQNGAAYPMTDPGLLSITGPDPSMGWAPNSYGGFFDWKITAGNPCARVPVMAIENCPLPVDLLLFDGWNEGEKNKLVWQTASEENNAEFVIERSVDGIHFTAIGTVSGNGTTEGVVNYSTYDVDPLNGINYYRLKQIDYDGTYTYSNIISIENSEGTEIALYPNPANNEVTLSINTAKGVLAYELLDVLGRVYKSGEAGLQDGVNDVVLDISDVTSGVYFLRTTVNSGTTTITRLTVK